MGDIDAQCDVRVPVFLSLFGPALFHACDLLVVQTGAWDRYGERATLCFSSVCQGRAGSQGRRDAPQGFRRAVAHAGEAIL